MKIRNINFELNFELFKLLRFDQAGTYRKRCEDWTELIYSIDHRINNLFLLIWRSVIALGTRNMFYHLLNHVTYLAVCTLISMSELTWETLLSQFVVHLFSFRKDLKLSLALLHGIATHSFISFLSVVTLFTSRHYSVLFCLLSFSFVKSHKK